MLEALTALLALVGLGDLAWRCKNWLQESVFLSLKHPDKVLHWQQMQITRASYLGAKKLYTLSKLMPESKRKERAVELCKELVEIRKRMYTNIKSSGFNETEFGALSTRAKDLYSEYMREVREGAI